jgi:uncharacterized protein (TIGR00296 family)
LTRREKPQQKPTEVDELTLTEGKSLVHMARLAITTYLENNQMIQPEQDISERLRRKSGVFVTLNSVKPTHELRGCIGFPYPEEPLASATIKAAIYAATEDPRFPSVSLQEMNNSIAVEVTALTPPKRLEAKDHKSFPEFVTVGRHGLIVEGHGRSGLLLPQVATEWKWDASEFLTNCCLKAGLPPDSWLLEDIRVKVFEGEIFEEVEPSGEVRRKAIGES